MLRGKSGHLVLPDWLRRPRYRWRVRKLQRRVARLQSRVRP
jgi:hypothetical protein